MRDFGRSVWMVFIWAGSYLFRDGEGEEGWRLVLLVVIFWFSEVFVFVCRVRK